MSKRRIILLPAFLLVLSAGVVVGKLWTRLPAAVPLPGKGPSWLADQLDLSPEQRQQMDSIWSDTQQKLQKTEEIRRGFDKTRDQAIAALLSPEQRIVYGKILDDFHAHRADLDKDREKLIHDAEARSRALLTDAQKLKWDAMRTSHPHHDHDHGPPHGPMPATDPGSAG
jgi:hypothetical protein